MLKILIYGGKYEGFPENNKRVPTLFRHLGNNDTPKRQLAYRTGNYWCKSINFARISGHPAMRLRSKGKAAGRIATPNI